MENLPVPAPANPPNNDGNADHAPANPANPANPAQANPSDTPTPHQPAPANPAGPAMPVPNLQPIPNQSAPQIILQQMLNWSHFKPEFAGRPEDDAEAHLHTND